MTARGRAAAVVAVWAGMMALAISALRPDPAKPPELSSEGRIYRTLVAGDYSAVAQGAGLDLTGARGVLPPAKADRERTWLVYVGFEEGEARHRLSYQVIPSGEEPRHARDLAKMGYDPCEKDFYEWECFDVYGSVVIQGEVLCLEEPCRVTRTDAKVLLDLGREHLRTVIGAR